MVDQMTFLRCAGNKFEFGGVLYTKSYFHSVLWTNSPTFYYTISAPCPDDENIMHFPVDNDDDDQLHI